MLSDLEEKIKFIMINSIGKILCSKTIDTTNESFIAFFERNLKEFIKEIDSKYFTSNHWSGCIYSRNI